MTSDDAQAALTASMTALAIRGTEERWIGLGLVERHRDVSVFALALVAECESLRSQLAEAKQALRAFVEWHGGAHSEECPEDDTCDCIGGAINARVNAVLRDD